MTTIETTSRSLNRVAVNVGDRIFPAYDVPVVDGRKLYNRAENPVGRYRGAGEIVLALSERGFPMVELRAVGLTKDGKTVMFERTKFVSERSVWTNADVVRDSERLIANIRSRVTAVERSLGSDEGVDRMRKLHRALNLLDSALIEAVYGKVA